MDVKHLNVTLDATDWSKGAYQMAKEVRPHWKRNDVQFRTTTILPLRTAEMNIGSENIPQVFTGGITNHLIGVHLDTDPEDMILVRIYGKSSDLFVDRNKERKIFKLLHYRGYAPKLYLTFENGMVFEYLPGATLNIELSEDPRVYPLVARMAAKIHKIDYEDDTHEPRTPQIWDMIDQFVDLIPEVFSNTDVDSRFRRCCPDGKVGLKMQLDELKRELRDTTNPVVFCHNDLILLNIIYEEKKNCVTFIDYEYAGLNYQAFDIALHFISTADESGFENPHYPSEDYKLHWAREYVKEFENSESVSESKVRQLYEHVKQFIPIANFFLRYLELHAGGTVSNRLRFYEIGHKQVRRIQKKCARGALS